MVNFKQRLTAVKAVLFDIDGVLTDGRLHMHSDGTVSRTFHARDGFALQQAVKSELIVGIVSAAREEILRERFLKLGIHNVILNCNDKLAAYDELKSSYGISDSEVLFMGDDLPDLEVMRTVGIPVCPDDAVHEIRAVSIYISPNNGGEGCVRDIIEQVLRAQGKWKF
jgi:3-deoxy-D-manno-octulosonate 8-phosphate phosphatase (KDO 8-P phosphatase)